MNIFNLKHKFERSYYFLKLFLLIFISMIFIEIVFKLISFKLDLGFEVVRILFFTFNTSLIVSFILSFIKPKISKALLLTFIFYHGLYSLVQLTFNNLLGNYMSLSASNGGGLTRTLSQLSSFIASIKLEYLLVFIPFIFICILLKQKHEFLKYEKYNKLRLILNILLIIISFLLSYLSLTLNIVQDKNQIKSNIELYKNPSMLELSFKQFGSFRFFLIDIRNLVFNIEEEYELEVEEVIVEEEPNYTRYIDDTLWKAIINKEDNKDIKQLHNYFINKSITPKNEYTGLFKDKNLVLFMVEAFDMISIDKNITPTLYKMANEGMYFDTYYAPKYSCTTGESEYIAETSIIPSSTVCTPNSYMNNDYSTSIFNVFNNNNYYTSSYHSWNDEFYTRSKLHINMGSQLYLDHDDMNMTRVSGWPLDTDMLKDSYSNYIDKDKFFTFYITSSMHFPYDYDTSVTKKHWNKVKNTDYPTVVKRYLAKAAELDETLEQLINILKEKDILDDTVIVLFGDHHPLKIDQTYLNKYSNIDRFEDFNMDRLPFIIYNSEIESKTISKTMSTFDILPTLSNLFDLNYDPRYYMGVDIFSEEESIVIFTTGSWITDKGLYNSSKNSYKSLTDDEMTDEYIEKINKVVNDKFFVSDRVLNLNYFKYRFDLTND